MQTPCPRISHRSRRAMHDCKEIYPDKRFFVINANTLEFVKLEAFPIM